MWTRSPSTPCAVTCARPSASPSTTAWPTSTAGTRSRVPIRLPQKPRASARLRNVALGYLTCRGKAEDMARVAAHFAHARNATDEVSALAMLSELRSPERVKAFDRFYERWKDDHLVIDNWFAYQAASPLASSPCHGRQAHQAPAVLDQEPQQGAGADRHLRHGQPGQLQPAGRHAATSSSPTACWRSTPSTRRSQRG